MCLLFILMFCIGACDRDCPTLPDEYSGDVSISIEPDTLSMSWLLVGPDSLAVEGLGDANLNGVDVGTYSITWGALEGWHSPSDTFAHLEPDSLISFQGQYYEVLGTVMVDTEPDSISAPWQLLGPFDFYTLGNGDSLLTDMKLGEYRIVWGSIFGWNSPDPEVNELTVDSTLAFWGEFFRPFCTVILDPNPSYLQAPWSLNGPDEFFEVGQGNTTFSQLHPGEYAVTWNEVDGWSEPPAQTRFLAGGETYTFLGEYEELLPGFVYIRANTFMMGSPESEYFAQSDEWPRHAVTLTTPFYIGATEVTNQQYVDVAQWALDLGYCTATDTTLQDAIGGSTELLLNLDSDYYPEYAEIFFDEGQITCINPDHPVKEVSWYGAVAYCDWLSLKEGLPMAYDHSTWLCNNNDPYSAMGYRLPTEAEWEFACRSGSSMAYANGPNILNQFYDPVLDEIGWYGGNDEGWTSPVAQKIPNAWGLYDMHGNLYELVNDWYQSDYYTSYPVSDPVGPASGNLRVARGGIWHGVTWICRSANRNRYGPGSPGPYVGFRPVISGN